MKKYTIFVLINCFSQFSNIVAYSEIVYKYKNRKWGQDWSDIDLPIENATRIAIKCPFIIALKNYINTAIFDLENF